MNNWHGKVLAVLLAVVALVSGCSMFRSSPAPVRQDVPEYYTVAPGDTLQGIAFRYGLDYQQVAKWNRLKSPDLIKAGQRLRLMPPGARPGTGGERGALTAKRAPDSRSGGATGSSRSSTAAAAGREKGRGLRSLAVTRGDWVWPTQGIVVKGYDPDVPGGKGIEISGNPGQPVLAASPGAVVYSGSGLPGYGRLVIVKHSDSLLSAYGYLGKILVREGDSVRVGQAIAELESSNPNRPVLHFEIRQNGKPIDPFRYLPS